jgi:hypothetical protein
MRLRVGDAAVAHEQRDQRLLRRLRVGLDLEPRARGLGRKIGEPAGHRQFGGAPGDPRVAGGARKLDVGTRREHQVAALGRDLGVEKAEQHLAGQRLRREVLRTLGDGRRLHAGRQVEFFGALRLREDQRIREPRTGLGLRRERLGRKPELRVLGARGQGRDEENGEQLSPHGDGFTCGWITCRQCPEVESRVRPRPRRPARDRGPRIPYDLWTGARRTGAFRTGRHNADLSQRTGTPPDPWTTTLPDGSRHALPPRSSNSAHCTAPGPLRPER